MSDLDCNEVVELVTSYLDDALDEDTRRDVRDHLTGCDGCTEYVAQLRATTAALHDPGDPAEHLPDGVRAELLRAFRTFPR